MNLHKIMQLDTVVSAQQEVIRKAKNELMRTKTAILSEILGQELSPQVLQFVSPRMGVLRRMADKS